MLKDTALIILLSLIGKHLAIQLKVPGLIGIMLVGIFVRSQGLISLNFLELSKDLRLMALIVILLRAGLGLEKKPLQKAGYRAILMSSIPCVLEGVTITLVAPHLLGVTTLEAAMLGFILAAVSPAVVVPSMMRLQTEGYGVEKGVPTLILAGASIDDVFAISIFSLLLNTYLGESISLLTTSVALITNLSLGLGIGIGIGLCINKLFTSLLKNLRSTEKLLILIAISFALTELAKLLPFSSLLSIMTLGFVLQIKTPARAERLSTKLERIWVFASIILFFLVGADLPLETALSAGLKGFIVISIGLIGRSVGVFLALIGSKFNFKERLFCAIAYLPKATVQAAIGALPLTYGVKNGEVILSIATLSIIITAPLGAYLIEKTAPILLSSKSNINQTLR